MKLATKDLCKEMAGKYVVKVCGMKRTLSYKHIRTILDAFFTKILKNVGEGNVVVVTNFGTFRKKQAVYKKIYDFSRSKTMYNYPVTSVSFKASDATKKKMKLSRSVLEIPEAADHHATPQLL